ncbi:MAG: hypothetical protein NTZ32_06450 [Planctomycetales bacterium]|nr:hypothetical protein [Planctomycetales bacterium]
MRDPRNENWPGGFKLPGYFFWDRSKWGTSIFFAVAIYVRTSGPPTLF